MFLDFYGAESQPFGATPDPRFLYPSSSHREALASLFYAVETGRGFAALVAEPGMGKTTLLFHLLERLRVRTRTVFLFQRQASEQELLRYLVQDLQIGPPAADVGGLYSQLNDFLYREAGAGRTVVVIVDEAQNQDFHILEVLRMLSNFETADRKLLQIILSGQPQLGRMLELPELSQLRQRIGVVARLVPLTANEVRQYIDHRLQIAGLGDRNPFDSKALKLISERSGGIPRNINNLCFNAMTLGCALGSRRIDRRIVNEVLNDLRLDNFDGAAPPVGKPQAAPPRPPSEVGERLWTAAKFALVLLVVGLVLALAFVIRREPAAAPLVVRAQEEAPPPPATPVAKAKTATVRQGDSLFKLCNRELGVCDTKVIAEIVRLNPQIVDLNMIHPGDVISLPLPGSSGIGGLPKPARNADMEISK